MLRSPVLASFADSKLLDLSRASDSITSRINRTLCVMRYIRYVRINACAVGTVGSSSLAGELLLLRRGFCTIVLHQCIFWHCHPYFTLQFYSIVLYYPARACASRGKAIGCLSVCLSAQKSPDLKIQASETRNHNESIETKKLTSLYFKLFDRAHERRKHCFYWPRLSTAPPCAFCSCAYYHVGKGRQQSTRILHTAVDTAQCANRCT